MDYDNRRTAFNTSNMFAKTSRLDRSQVLKILKAMKNYLVQTRFDELLSEITSSIGLPSSPGGSISSGGSTYKEVSDYQKQIDLIKRAKIEVAGAQVDVNVVTKSNGSVFGHSYIWTDSTIFYHILTGSNLDGTPRVKEVVDMLWQPPADCPEDLEDFITQEAKRRGITSPESDDGFTPVGKAWSDIGENECDEYEYLVAEMKLKYTPPTIIINDDPIIPPFTCEYTQAQRDDLLKDIENMSTPNIKLYPEYDLKVLLSELADNPATQHYSNDPKGWISDEWKRIEDYRISILGPLYEPIPRRWDPEWNDELPIFVPDGHEPAIETTILIDRAHVKEPEPNEHKSVLCCRNAPHWVTVKMLQTIFSKYSTDKVPRIVRKDGAETFISYPDISLRPFEERGKQFRKDDWGGNTQMIIITFSDAAASEWDGLFTLQMCRRVTLDAPIATSSSHCGSTNGSGGGSATLIFSLWVNNEHPLSIAALRGRGGFRGRGGRGGRGGHSGFSGEEAVHTAPSSMRGNSHRGRGGLPPHRRLMS
jgi:hypothetical protein